MKRNTTKRRLTKEQAKAVVREIINKVEQALVVPGSESREQLERVFRFPLGLSFEGKQEYARKKLKSLRRLLTRMDGPLNQEKYFIS